MIDLTKIKVDPACAAKITANVAIRRQVLPFLIMDGVLHVACADVKNTGAVRAVEQLARQKVKPVEVDEKVLRQKIRQIYGDRPDKSLSNTWTDSDQATDISATILNSAILKRASDIHVDPDNTVCRILFRVDGHMELFREIPMSSFSGLASRIKVLAGMDIAEKRTAQDGYINYKSDVTSRNIELRAATIPTKYGEKITLRVMASDDKDMSLEELGVTGRNLQKFNEILEKPHGMVIICGPTGSGKSTTLYAALTTLYSNELQNIITIEDPVEYDISGISQVEVSHPKLSFANALKSVLRHDPDVVMVGEMRDLETAEIAIRASMTGHLVLSTLHTNSAPGVITRLIDMGVDAFLVGAVLQLAVSQRLARRLCPQCREERAISTREALMLKNPDLEGKTCFDARGCMHCGGKGYSGRLGLFEMLFIDHEMSRMISSGCNEDDLRQLMSKQGQAQLIEDGVSKILSGETSIEEVLRNTF